MTGIELLETYPKAAKVIAEFYNNKLIDSMTTSTEDVSEEFKEMLRQQSFDNQYVATFIDSNPRFLFDVFDENEVFIQIIVYTDKKFTYNVNQLGTTKSFNTRKEAEAEAVEGAFQILNDKL